LYKQADARMVGGEAGVEVDVAGPLTLRARADAVRGTTRATDEPLPLIPPARVTLGAELHSRALRRGERARLAVEGEYVTLQTLRVPGAAVAVVRDGKLVFAQGYGVRTLGDSSPVDAHTLFQIASNTKAFTTAALAMLVDEGKLAWDDPVTKYLPDFQLYDPYVTREFTLRDLVTHRSGLGLGAGDLLWFHSSYSRAEIIH